MTSINRFAKLRRLGTAILVLIFGLAAPAAWADLDDIVVKRPDTCTSRYTPGEIQEMEVEGVGHDLVIRWTAGSLALEKVALIVNGNGFGKSQYEALAEHLALNGFIAAVVVRPSVSGGDAAFVLDALQATLDALGIAAADPDLGVALIGHSKGGGLVVEAAILNDDAGLGYPIDAVASLAPTMKDVALDGTDASSFLLIYGSQDEDVDGYNNDQPSEAFFAYDNAGSEGSTTCNSPPCILLEPSFERTMVFVYGADHAGLVGLDFLPADAENEPDLEYLAGTDQLCIVKAYVTGFLRRQLLGKDVYKGLLRGEWQPPSVEAITTVKPDAFGNPAGSDLRLFVQTSPPQRRVIQSFEADLGAPTLGPGVVAQHNSAGQLSGDAHYVRHYTGFAVVGWEDDRQAVPWIRWPVPAGSRDASSFTHFAVRLGQLQAAPAPYLNPWNGDQALWIGLEDGGGTIAWFWIDDVPPPDLYTDGAVDARSAMHTVRIHVDRFRRQIQIDDVVGVYLAFPSLTTGTLLVDSLEWHRD